MANDTVKKFAETVRTPVERLLTQLKEAGLDITDPSHVLAEDEKMKLLAHLRQSHGKTTDGGKISIRRRSNTSELKAGGNNATKGRTVAVQVKKKRVIGGPGASSNAANSEQEQINAEAEAARVALAERRTLVEAEQQALEDKAAARKAELDAFRQQENAKQEGERSNREAEEAKLQADADAARIQAEQAAATAARQAANPDAPRRAAEPAKAKAKPAGKTRGKPPGNATLRVAPGKGPRRQKGRKSRRNVVSVETTHVFEKPSEPVARTVEVPETIVVGDLAQAMAVKAGEVVKTLMGMGAMVTINQVIDQDTAMLVVEEMGHIAVVKVEETIEDSLMDLSQEDSSDLERITRPPVVTIMGHVDHGKTSLLDYIRRAKVADGEAGGITQHIGAYHVETKGGVITFLDTPGHAAFTAMRARGANATDIAIIVVAADDGVMPQTAEAVQHAKAAGIPMIFAVNKMDKEGADPDRIKNELSVHEIVPEEWGGEHQFVPVSALTGDGIDDLLEAITLQAEVLELTAAPDAPAQGVVIESSLEKGRGPVATVLVKDGTLRQGDMILCGQEYGRIRAMFDENGKAIKECGPSIPCAILGLSGAPNAGESAMVVQNERRAREVADYRKTRDHELKLRRQQAAKMENLFAQMENGKRTNLNIVLKADVAGSVEALRESLKSLSNEEVNVNVVSSGVGGINATDVDLAVTSEAMLIGFNVRADVSARKQMTEHEIEPAYYSIIYQAIDTIKVAMSGMMAPEVRETILGTAEVREVFRSSSFGAAAGCLVMEGVMKSAEPIRVLRDNVVIFEGELSSLRRFKDDVSEVKSGVECGLGVKNYNDIREGDQVECFKRTEHARVVA
jgi:translation initiation factor IF-2